MLMVLVILNLRISPTRTLELTNLSEEMQVMKKYHTLGFPAMLTSANIVLRSHHLANSAH